jgi:hypothetical protein
VGLRRARVWNGALGGAVAATAVFAVPAMPMVTEPLGGPQVTRFHRAVGDAPSVLLDQFNLIPFFAQHHEWDWHLAWQGRREHVWQIWDLSKGAERLHVCRQLDWLSDPSNPQLYEDARFCMERTSAGAVAIYRPQQDGFAPTWDVARGQQLALELGTAAGLLPQASAVVHQDFFANFARLDEPTAGRRIEVVQATYGGNCRATPGNATPILRSRCDGRAVCAFRVDSREVRDPAPGCAKDFVATWSCPGGDRPRTATLPPEAGFGSVALLSCAR